MKIDRPPSNVMKLLPVEYANDLPIDNCPDQVRSYHAHPPSIRPMYLAGACCDLDAYGYDFAAPLVCNTLRFKKLVTPLERSSYSDSLYQTAGSIGEDRQ
jgi:hypothetical protein